MAAFSSARGGRTRCGAIRRRVLSRPSQGTLKFPALSPGRFAAARQFRKSANPGAPSSSAASLWRALCRAGSGSDRRRGDHPSKIGVIWSPGECSSQGPLPISPYNGLAVTMFVRCVGKCNFSGLCPDHGERGHSFRVADDPGVNGDKLISFASLLDICSRCQSVLNGGRYYMDLGVENQSDTAIASQDMRAYIAGPSGAVLRILVLDPKDGPIQPGKKRDYILDVAGYTDALL